MTQLHIKLHAASGPVPHNFIRILTDVAQLLGRYQPDKKIEIEVRLERGPVTYPKQEGHPYYVILNYRPNEISNMGAYIYEFMHEFCHILSNIENTCKDLVTRSTWLDETLCECAAFFALKSIGESDDAEFNDIKAPSLSQYNTQQGLLKDPHPVSLAQLATESLDKLNSDYYYLASNKSILELVNYFMESPNRWSILASFNQEYTNDDPVSSKAEKWLANTSGNEKGIVETILSLLGLT